jgi:hypothetical protein
MSSAINSPRTRDDPASGRRGRCAKSVRDDPGGRSVVTPSVTAVLDRVSRRGDGHGAGVN